MITSILISVLTIIAVALFAIFGATFYHYIKLSWYIQRMTLGQLLAQSWETTQHYEAQTAKQRFYSDWLFKAIMKKLDKRIEQLTDEI